MIEDFHPRDPQRFAAAIRRFDEENARDPKLEPLERRSPTRRDSRCLDRAGSETGAPPPEQLPRELLYAQWLSDWVLRLCPQASEELRLAARCQHLCRWMLPRESHPMTRPGYLRWREELKRFHARKAGEILQEVGYPEEVITRVQVLNLKKGFPEDPESRVLEDALCLVFLEHQLGALADKTSDQKMVNALQKAWNKMTPTARAIAKSLPYPPRQHALLERALATARPA